jgi:hypothetical protein
VPLDKELALGVGDRGERIGAGDDRPDFAALNVADQSGEDTRLRDGAAEQPQVLEVLRAQVKLDDRPGDGSRDSLATAASQYREQRGELRAAADVDHDIHGLWSERGDEIRIAGQNAVSAETAHLASFFRWLPARGRDRRAAERAGRPPIRPRPKRQ